MRVLLAFVTVLAAAVPAARAQQALSVPDNAGVAVAPSQDRDQPSIVEIRVVTKAGETFRGLTRVTPQLKRLHAQLTSQDRDLADVPPKSVLEIRGFNGLNGTIGIKFEDMKSLEFLKEVSEEEFKKAASGETADRDAKWAAEKVRLAKVAADRQARQQAEAGVTADGAAAPVAPVEPGAQAPIPPEMQRWLDEFPPDKGWLPARKAQLYYQSVVLGNGAMSETERRWLDNYDAWYKAFEVWFDRQNVDGKADDMNVDGEGSRHQQTKEENQADGWREMPPAQGQVETPSNSPAPAAPAAPAGSNQPNG
jgi:hypothetical protein